MLEAAWAVGLDLSYGLSLSRPLFAGLTTAAMASAGSRSALTVLHLPIGNASAIGVGIGTAGTAVAGILLFDKPALFDDPPNPARLAAMAVIVAGVDGRWHCEAEARL